MMKRISSAEPLTGNVLRLTYASGECMDVDFTETITRGGVFARLGDESYFQQVSVSKDGRFVEWPDELDFCADALFERAHSSVQ